MFTWLNYQCQNRLFWDCNINLATRQMYVWAHVWNRKSFFVWLAEAQRRLHRDQEESKEARQRRQENKGILLRKSTTSTNYQTMMVHRGWKEEISRVNQEFYVNILTYLEDRRKAHKSISNHVTVNSVKESRRKWKDKSFPEKQEKHAHSRDRIL